MGVACSSEKSSKQSNEQDVYNLALSYHNNQLANQNLYIRPIKTGPASLYKAIADQLEGVEVNYQKYQDIIIKYMKDNESYYSQLINTKFSPYLHQLKQEQIYPGVNEIDALCNALQLNTIVYQLHEKTAIYQPKQQSYTSKVIQLQYNKDHESFNSVRLLGDNFQSPAIQFKLSHVLDLIKQEEVLNSKPNINNNTDSNQVKPNNMQFQIRPKRTLISTATTSMNECQNANGLNQSMYNIQEYDQKEEQSQIRSVIQKNSKLEQNNEEDN